MSKFIVVATITDGTPFECLYGQERVCFDSEAEAIDAADRFSQDPVWGKYGDRTAVEEGFHYEVREVNEDDLAPGGEFAAWVD